MTERILYDAGGYFDHRGTYHPHHPPTVTITTAPEPDWRGRAEEARLLADSWEELHAALVNDWQKALAERNIAACHAVRLDDKAKQMGGQILALECELCEKVEHIKGLEGELESARIALGLHNEHWRELADTTALRKGMRDIVTLHGEVWDEDCGEVP